MLVLHIVGHSLVRFTPARIATYWGRYTEHSGVGICLRRAGGRGKFRESLNPQGIWYIQREPQALRDLVRNASVIHCHDDCYPSRFKDVVKLENKKLVFHAHIGDIPQRYFHPRTKFIYDKRVKHACITNGYGRHFDAEAKRSRVPWGRLPDILDIEHPVFRPAEEPNKKEFLVVFTYSNNREPGGKINAKAPKSTRRLLAHLMKHPKINIQLVTNLQFEEAMALKRRATIVLDEVFSPYTHLSALEGAAVGVLPMTNYDAYTAKELCDFVGAPVESYPFVKVTPKDLAEKVLYYYEHQEEARELGRAARAWMEQYYHPRILLQRYLEFYENGP